MDPEEFSNLKNYIDEISNTEGYNIFYEIIKKYPIKNVECYDVIINSLCFALLHFRYYLIDKNEYKTFNDLVFSILSKNMDVVKNDN